MVPMKKASAALLLVLAGVSSWGLYSTFGVSFLVLLCSLGLAAALWRFGQAPRAPATVRSVGTRRTAP